MASNCSHSNLLALDRPLRFEHAPAEAVSVFASGASLQLPEGHLPLGGAAMAANAVGIPPEHARARALVHRAAAWLTVSERVIAEGPDKWALHQLLVALALILALALVSVVLLQCCATMLRRRNAK